MQPMMRLSVIERMACVSHVSTCTTLPRSELHNRFGYASIASFAT